MRHTPPGGRGLRHYSEDTGELQSQPVEEERREREELDMTNERKRGTTVNVFTKYKTLYIIDHTHYTIKPLPLGCTCTYVLECFRKSQQTPV